MNSRSSLRAITGCAALVAVAVLGKLLGVATGKPVAGALILAGGVVGCIYALFGIGLVLIYRSTRVINFAHAGLGVLSGSLFLELGSSLNFPYWASASLAVAAGAASGALVELVVVRRFSKSARLVLTVATIGLAELLTGLAFYLPRLFKDDRPRNIIVPSPFRHFHAFTWKPVTFTGDQVMLVVVTALVLAAAAIFLTRTRVGIALRGSSENAERAELLGVDTAALSTVAWSVAGALAAAAVVLELQVSGLTSSILGGGSFVGLGLLLTGLAAGVIGRMESLPITAAAAIGLGMLEESVDIAFGKPDLVNLAVLAVIATALLAQRTRRLRVDEGALSSWAAVDEVRPVPPELAGLRSVRTARRWVISVLAVIVLGVPWVMSPGQTTKADTYLLFGMVVISLVVLTGWAGQISLGQFGFTAVGGLVGGAVTSSLHLPFLLGVVAAGMVGAGAAMLLGFGALRVRGLNLAVITLSFAVVAQSVLLNRLFLHGLIPTRVNRPQLFSFDFRDERAFYYLCAGAVLLAWLGAAGLRRGRTGRILIAVRDNERAAQSFGVNLVRTRLVGFAISGAIAAVAGMLLVSQQHALNQQAFGPDQSILIFLAAVIGGLGSIQGALLGTCYFAIVDIGFHGAAAAVLSSSVGVLLVLMFLPTGIGGLAYKVRDAFLRRVAIDNRIYVPALLANFGLAPGEVARLPLAPRTAPSGEAEDEVPVQYRLPSRIGVAGRSQSVRRWSVG